MSNPEIKFLSQNTKYNKLIEVMLKEDKKLIVNIDGLDLLATREMSLVIDKESPIFKDVRDIDFDNSVSKHMTKIFNNSEEMAHHVENSFSKNLSYFERAVMLLASNFLMFRDIKLVKMLFAAIESTKEHFIHIEFLTLRGQRDDEFLVIKTKHLPLAIFPVTSIYFDEN